MPPDTSSAAASALPTTTRVTRSSIRHSLTLASVGKALVDVMKSDGRGGGGEERAAKRPKEKETHSRRTSAIGIARNQEAPKPLAPAKEKDAPSPDAKAVTRRTRAAAASTASKTGSSSSEEQSDKKSTMSPPGITPVTRSSSLRAKRNSVGTALPKYKPKPGLETIKEPVTPPRKAGRKRASSSTDDDKDDQEASKSPGLEPPSPFDKHERAISPLPKRSAFNLTSAINVSPAPSTPPRKKNVVPPRTTPPSKPSPTRSLKTKAAETAKKDTAARPPSAASSVSSLRTRTPTTPPSSLRNAFGLGRTKSTATQQQSPLRKVVKGASAASSASNSPKSIGGKSAVSKSDATRTPTVTVDLGDSSTDSVDANDVEFLLSSAVISPTAPTPAMPRLRSQPIPRNRDVSGLPETPSRAGKAVAGRSQPQFLSPIPASTDNSPLFPRFSNKNRQSILSWDQLAASANKSPGEDDVEHMLHDIQAPFNASAVASPQISPMRMNLDLPDSPMLSALPSPGGFTSISQVLLPDSTPSPARTTHPYESTRPEVPAVDGAILTLLRLQLASAEQLAQERAARIEELESKLLAAQELRVRDEETLSQQVSQLEEQLRGSLMVRERTNEEKEAYINTLHEQLGQVEAAREQAIQQAVLERLASAESTFSVERQRWAIIDVAKGAAVQWEAVADIAEGELEFVRSSRETLAVLLAGLDESQRRLRSL